MAFRLLTSLIMMFLFVACAHHSRTQSGLRIVGGEEVTDSSDPTMKSTVALLNNGTLCSGTLIGPNQVLSAAHCIESGEITIASGPSPKAVPGLKVILARSHPKWDKGPNDVSILIFEGTLPSNLVPVSIAPLEGISEGSAVTLAGYGVTGERNKDSGTLRKVKAQVRAFDKTTKEFAMQEGLGVGSCYGDSGGPAYVALGSELAVIGATSRGSDCDTGDGLYGDVRYFQGWYKCVAKEAGKPLRYLANDDSNVDCDPKYIDADVDSGGGGSTTRSINVAIGPQSGASPSSYNIYFAVDRSATGSDLVD